MTAQDLLRAIRQSGGTVVVEDGDLRIKIPTGRISSEDRQIIAEYKVEIVSLLADETVSSEIVVANDQQHADDLDLDLVGWDQAVEIPDPCGTCGSLWLWWDLAGGRHCMKCEPTVRSEFLAVKAARLRSARPVPLARRAYR